MTTTTTTTKKTKDHQGTFDIKCEWLQFLDDVAVSLSELRRNVPTICQQAKPMDRISASDIVSMLSAEKAIGELQSRLMAMWGINQSELSEWTNSEPADYAKNMGLKKSTASHSSNSQHGQTRKSQRRCI